MRIILSCLLTLWAVCAAAQKKPLTIADFDDWKSVSAERISPDGKWVCYESRPGKGDGDLVIVSTNGDTTVTIPRGTGAAFFGEGRFLALRIAPPVEETKKKKPASRDPKPDSLVVLSMKTLSNIWTGAGKGLRVSRDASLAAWEEPVVNEDSTSKEKLNRLILYDFAKSDTVLTALRPKQYRLSRDGAGFAYLAGADSSRTVTIYRKGKTLRTDSIPRGAETGAFELESRNGSALAYILRPDTSSNRRHIVLYDLEKRTRKEIVPEDTVLNIASGSEIGFSKTGGLLSFRTEPFVEKKIKTDSSETEEKVKIEIWRHTDSLLMTQKSKTGPETYTSLYNLDTGRTLTLAQRHLTVRLPVANDAPDHILVRDRGPYIYSSSWRPYYCDLWVRDVRTGERRVIAEDIMAEEYVSPDGETVVFYDRGRASWFGYVMREGSLREISSGAGVSFADSGFDNPAPAPSAGFGGWIDVSVKKKSRRHIPDLRPLAYDGYDIWILDPAGKETPVCLTRGMGRKENKKFTIRKCDADRDLLDLDSDLLTITDLTFKTEYLARLNTDGTFTTIGQGDYRYRFRGMASDDGRYLWSRENFTTFPDLWTSDRSLGSSLRLTDINPGIDTVAWGTALLTRWEVKPGVTSEGVLYLPAGYVEGEKYPTILYFYETHSEDLNKWFQPASPASTVNPALYTSNGYVVFMPDIKYETGTPGRTAVEYITSAANALVERGIADEDRIAIQGQSWGGYQVAHIITQTDMFRCACSGAPVSNMLSAYTGIRTESGISRMLQYEQGQSRLGVDPWTSLGPYLENSPILYLDRVNTPLLLRHNDRDEAVPYQQGLDMYLALRRLGKEVWLINYPGEAHNLRRRETRTDWNIRMKEFFDHYLMDAPVPGWMIGEE